MKEAGTKYQIDFTKIFIPPQQTPLFHTEIYDQLTKPQQLYYNQLCACYVNEQIMFLETTIGKHMPEAMLKRKDLPNRIRSGIQELYEEEIRHAEMFVKINEMAFPNLYKDGPSYFVKSSSFLKSFVKWQLKRPLFLPAFTWLGLMLEEKSSYMAKEFVPLESEIDSYFFQIQKAHLADEENHISFGLELFEFTWGKLSKIMRKVNVTYFSWMVKEFFCAPKRGGVMVLKELYEKFDDLPVPYKKAKKALDLLAQDTDYIHTVYSRSIVPKAFDLFDQKKEFFVLKNYLPSYS